MSFVPGIAALPNSTAVPSGLDMTPVAATVPLAVSTGKEAMKPRLVVEVGSPLTVTSRVDWSAEKNTWDRVLAPPVGMVD